ncbi:hypothetical protein K4K61_001958 [Colletotrichum sp. SAR11_59]|nr:hypothetical protein K4K61_001958 [Colletotrichum sp. SAR11_59]
MPDSDSITSREMAEYLNNKSELSERDKEYLTLDAKKNQAAAAREVANINAYANWATKMNNNNLSTANANANANAANNTLINANNADDDDDRRSVLSSRIMRSGLTNIGQLVRKAPGLQSAQDRQTVEAAMRDPRYLDSWRGTKTVQQSQPQKHQPQSFLYQPRPAAPSVQLRQPQHQPQPQHDAASVLQQHQDRQHQHQQQPLPLYAPFTSLQDIDAELDRVLHEQKGHLFEAVDCEVRVKVLHWHRHAMMEREANANTAKNNKE